nr:hypothetical protein [Tanacetum cinerariifolium]
RRSVRPWRDSGKTPAGVPVPGRSSPARPG